MKDKIGIRADESPKSNNNNNTRKIFPNLFNTTQYLFMQFNIYTNRLFLIYILIILSNPTKLFEDFHIILGISNMFHYTMTLSDVNIVVW